MTTQKTSDLFLSRASVSPEDIEAGSRFAPKFDGDGLIGCVVTEAGTNALLMFAHMNADALARSIDTGYAYFWSRSRKKLWKKGEESGNLLILMAAVAEMEGHADFAGRYWPQLTQWAEYLKAKGFDPENQLCTDDFAGRLAHNVNLSLKAILGIAAYAQLCQQNNWVEAAAEYRAHAEQMAQAWLQMADDGDHYRLTFTQPGSWSQKYNLVWDKLLGLNLFPPEVSQKEVAFYLRQEGRYGLPLDNRSAYTKLDWIVWSASLAEKPEDFRALVAPIYKWLNETESRVPLCDWYYTDSGRQAGFQARAVVGGVFIPLLHYPELWQKWLPKQP